MGSSPEGGDDWAILVQKPVVVSAGKNPRTGSVSAEVQRSFGNAYLVLTSPERKEFAVKLYNSQGKTLCSFTERVYPGQKKICLNERLKSGAALPQGKIFVTIKSGKEETFLNFMNVGE